MTDTMTGNIGGIIGEVVQNGADGRMGGLFLGFALLAIVALCVAIVAIVRYFTKLVGSKDTVLLQHIDKEREASATINSLVDKTTAALSSASTGDKILALQMDLRDQKLVDKIGRVVSARMDTLEERLLLASRESSAKRDSRMVRKEQHDEPDDG